MDKAEILRKVQGFYKQATRDKYKWQKRGREGFGFYIGGKEQWDLKDLEKLDSEKRPAITINKIFPKINLLTGAQRNNRQDYHVYPRKGGLRNWSEIFTALMKHAMDDNDAVWEFSDMFFNGLCSGKGWVFMDVEYDKDPIDGDLVIHTLSPFNVFEDPFADGYDLNRNGKYIFRRWSWTKDEILLNFPDSEKDIISIGLDTAADGTAIVTEETDDYRDEDRGEGDMPGSTDDLDASGEEQDKKYRIKECWWRSWEKRQLLVDIETLEVMVADKTKTTLVDTLAADKPERFKTVERIVPILHKTTFVNNVKLEHVDDPLKGITDFPFARFVAYYVDGYEMGVVENLKDPQMEHNKRRSQALHHLNQSANSGWIGDRDALTTDEWKDLAQFGSKPGIQIKKNPGKQLDRIEPVNISAGHLTIDQLSAQDMNDISGVNTELQGQTPEKAMSGKAIMLQQNQGMTISQVVFDNFNRTSQIFGNLLLEFIRKRNVYSQQEIQAIIDEEVLVDAKTQKPLDLESLGDLKIGKYGVKVAMSIHAPTMRIANYLTLLEMTQAGIPISPKFLLDAADIPNKDAIAADVEAKEQMAQQMAQQEMAMKQQGGKR